ncbi:ORF900 [White spot syndrome virus]|uniref:ORF900 n=1 Tax=White spot syndrome virus TaxID=342409 RepID=A0A2D3I766_9VIRU|nr:ORF900 [White spot syndrome virus]
MSYFIATTSRRIRPCGRSFTSTGSLPSSATWCYSPTHSTPISPPCRLINPPFVTPLENLSL